MKLRFYLLGVLLVILSSACSSQPTQDKTMEIQNAWARPAMLMNTESSSNESGHMSEGDSVSAAYMIIRNNGNSADKLVRVSSEICEAVELHTSLTEGDVTKMMPVDGIEIPANGQAELKPGGLHIMLIGLKQDLKVSDKIRLQLEFENSSPMEIEVEVRQMP
jgi:hypothetical protein